MRKDEGGLNGLTHVFIAMGAVAFFVAGVPILDAFGSWMSNVFNLKSVKLNKQASEVMGNQEEEVQENTHVIGFQIPSEEEEEYYEE